MAKKSTDTSAEDASAGGTTEGTTETPSINVLTQYIKDFSFENPRAPESLKGDGDTPQINININVNANPISSGENNDFEVELRIEADAEKNKNKMFKVELTYSGIFRLQNIPQESRAQVVLIECPRMLFPFARQIIADATRNGGFPPLLIDPVDFAALFRQRMEQQKGAGGTEKGKGTDKPTVIKNDDEIPPTKH